MHRDEHTLCGIRRALAALAESDGRYGVTCGCCGVAPVPADEFRFADDETAMTARRLVRLYRGRLRRYDPRTARHELVVRERPTGLPDGRESHGPTTNRNH